MFGRILDQMKEPFTTKAGMNDIKTYYSKVLPNIILNNDSKINLPVLTEISNTRIGTKQDTVRQQWLQTDKNKQLLLEKEAKCRRTNGLDAFDRLTQLSNTEDPSSQLRCGWINNRINPRAGGGAIGVSAGPLISKAPGAWQWDLKAATESMHIDICKRVQDCSDIGAVKYNNRCGWCDRLQRAVPILNGKVAYPWNKLGGCAASTLITNPSTCPASSNDPDDDRERNECDKLPDGRIPRNCVISKYKEAGCSDNGALGQALANGNDNDYMASIYSQKAYQVYQQRSSVNLNESGLKSGRVSVNDAMNEFDRLADEASQEPGALTYSARDLCFEKGALEAFDFCSELRENSTAPFTLDCLQKAFLSAGGQKSGLLYPGSTNMYRWNSYGKWKDVLAFINTMKRDVTSKDTRVQNLAIKNFYDATK